MASSDSAISPEAARVLVTDDDANIRLAVARSLTLSGYQADTAASGAQALEMLERTPYDVMILDLRMPDIDGMEVMHRLQEISPDLLVIILTGHATLESAISAVRLGAADYLRKPISVHDITAVVTGALHQRADTLRRRFLRTMNHALDTISRASSLPVSTVQSRRRFQRSGAITLDHERMIAIVSTPPSRTIELTSTEMSILAHLMDRPAQVISCGDLARTALAYHTNDIEAQSIVRPHISRLRRKLEIDPRRPAMLRTVRNKGYLFSPPDR